jgi:hypothetical protein
MTAKAKDPYLEQHETFLYPIVRVVAQGKEGAAGGSGIVVYSKARNKKDGKYETFVLTNHHVIAPLIRVRSIWDTSLGREVKKETRAEAHVEFFGYEDTSWITEASGKMGELVAWDEQKDLALVQLKSSVQVPNVAPIIQPDDVHKTLRIFSPVYCVGCGLGAPPLVTEGHIGGFDFLIDNYPYMLSTAPGIFGNSGGAVMSQETGEVIGVTARMPVAFIGFGGQAITHMMFSISPSTVYQFLQEQVYDFIVDPKRTSAQCQKERETRKRQAYEAMIKGVADPDEEERLQAEAEYGDDNS